ncbi:homospermidine synthase (spermidine-specific) [Desulfonatronum thiosulfatophilum]|uniref:Homospermidine synthase (Spermidine-specific) n=1 Tax=Desulfonatronum thiosulfatophilum TaxID=617002 RepID=A0A1G6CVE9_9BACT|nr:deoxyhypusine synthase family protein [Desulfonatronum thiosulfatophilum]SDB36859.1 homospermidine synthase (spermidine-specific) [Desulfonatronum thiosulfatophilum]
MNIRRINTLHCGNEDGLTPLKCLDLDTVQDFDELLKAMSRTAFGGRNLGEALDVLEAMVIDPECLVVGTFSGAMTVAKMSKVLCKMIDNGWLDIVISTGALMAHGFIESIGLKHYKYEPDRMCDKGLFEKGYNRVYDTLEPETNFMQAERVISRVMEEISDATHLSSESVCRAIGRHLTENYEGSGILKSAYARKVPVYIPAFTDSELALDIASHMLRKNPEWQSLTIDDPAQLPFQFNPFLDLFSYTKRILGAKRIGIFTIGGGVPRNWAQQAGPFLEILSQRIETMKTTARRFQYGVRICPEPEHWGGLSGCSYQEGISWGKFISPKDGGRFAEVPSDATLVWPLLVKALEQRLAKKKGKITHGKEDLKKTRS